MALLLVFAGLSWAQAFAEKDYKQLILGKWRGVGRQCDSAGNCKESVVDNISFEFFQDGTLAGLENDEDHKLSYTVEGDVVTIKDSNGFEGVHRIVALSDSTFLLKNTESEEIVKMVRVVEEAEDSVTEKNSELIIGKWKAVGENCNEAGECVEIIDSQWIEFQKNGMAKMTDGGKKSSLFVYRVNGNTLTLLTNNGRKVNITILLINKKEMFWLNNKKRQKLVRYKND